LAGVHRASPKEPFSPAARAPTPVRHRPMVGFVGPVGRLCTPAPPASHAGCADRPWATSASGPAADSTATRWMWGKVGDALQEFSGLGSRGPGADGSGHQGTCGVSFLLSANARAVSRRPRHAGPASSGRCLAVAGPSGGSASPRSLPLSLDLFFRSSARLGGHRRRR